MNKNKKADDDDFLMSSKSEVVIPNKPLQTVPVNKGVLPPTKVTETVIISNNKKEEEKKEVI